MADLDAERATYEHDVFEEPCRDGQSFREAEELARQALAPAVIHAVAIDAGNAQLLNMASLVEIGEKCGRKFRNARVSSVIAEEIPLTEEDKKRLNLLRSVYRHLFVMDNQALAMSVFSQLLHSCRDWSSWQCQSFGLMMASASAQDGHLLSGSFVANLTRVKWNRQLEASMVLDIFFTSMSLSKLFLQDRAFNIYSLVECMLDQAESNGHTAWAGVRHGVSLWHLWFAVCAFTLQLCLLLYLIFYLGNGFQNLEVNIPLAFLYFLFKLVTLNSQLTTAIRVQRVFWARRGEYAFLRWLDGACNIVLPLICLPLGTIVIMTSEKLVHAVVNIVVLVLVSELDDYLPALLMGLNTDEVLWKFVVEDAMQSFDSFTSDPEFPACRVLPGPVSSKDLVDINIVCRDGIQECVPHAVVERRHGATVSVSPVVSLDCLITKVSFRSRFSGGVGSVVDLMFWKLDGTMATIHTSAKDGIGELQEVTGLMFITGFQVEDAVYELRLCGAEGARALLKGLEFYSLWDVDRGAAIALRREAAEAGHVESKHSSARKQSALRTTQRSTKIGKISHAGFRESELLDRE